MRIIGVLILALLSFSSGCVTKTICANGSESFRSVFDPENSCKVRIRQVVVGTDIKVPNSIAIDGSAVSWDYDWSPSEFKAGQLEMGHIILKPEPNTTTTSKQ